MAQWMGRVGFELEILTDHVLGEVLKGARVFADETSLPTLAPGAGATKKAWLWAYARDDSTFVGSANPEEVRASQERYGKLQAGLMIEETLGKIAVALRDEGFGRFVVAGGETSGAVVSALGITTLRIGPEIAPGVPWTQALAPSGPALALKSGNFGQDDSFKRAFAAMLSKVRVV